MVTIYVVTGLLFLVLPGTFLGVWNLISISGRHSLGRPFPGLAAGPRACSDFRLDRHFHYRDRLLFALQNGGIEAGGREPRVDKLGSLDWRRCTAMGGQCQRVSMACSSCRYRRRLQLIAFLIFFATVSRHKVRPASTKRAAYRDVDEAGHRRDRRVSAGAARSTRPRPWYWHRRPHTRKYRTGWISAICFWRLGAFLFWRYGDSMQGGCRSSWDFANRPAVV